MAFSSRNPIFLIISLALVLAVGMISARNVPVEAGAESAGGADDDSRQSQEPFDMINVLSTYGYLVLPEDRQEGQQMDMEQVKHAIREYQRFNGLEVTGVAGPETIRKMMTPRCGNPDIAPGDGSGSADDPQSFTTLGSRWRKDTVTWRPRRLSSKLDSSQQMTTIQKAFDLWSKVIPMKFRFSPEEADVEILFARGEHGDGWGNRFKGRGGVLAHAYGPGQGIGGDTHFDEDEDWSVGTGVGADLPHVAAHEFGHALGLGHSSVPEALMAPYYRYTPELALHQDDIKGIQSLYGPKIEPSPTTTTPTTTTTTMTTTTQAPTTTSQDTTTTTDEPVPDFCGSDFRLDAITKGPDGFVYAFHQSQVYKIGGGGLERGFPKPIGDVFPGAPSRNIRAASFLPSTGKTYLFKGYRVWRFTGFQLDQGYPKSATNGTRKFIPASAFTFTYNGNSRIFLLNRHLFWEWNAQTENTVPGYPLSLPRYFSATPTNPDAAFMNARGNLFFFKYNSLKRFEYRGARPESYPLGTALFGSVCPSNSETPDILVTLEPPAFLADPQLANNPLPFLDDPTGEITQ